MSRLGFVCQVFHPDGQATSQLFSELFAALAKRGREVSVLAGYPSSAVQRESCPRAEDWRGVRILRGGLAIDFKRNLALRAAGYASYCLWVVWQLLFRLPSDTRLLVATNPPFLPVLVYWCSRVRRRNYDLMLLDIYPDGLVGVGRLASDALVARLWRRGNRAAMASARRVLVLGRDMAELCRVRYGVDLAKVHCTPHWSPMAVSTPPRAERTKLWARLQLEGKFVVQYSGNMGLWHDVDCIVRAAAALREERHIHFLMIGGGGRRAAAEKLGRELGLRNMTWLPYQSVSELEDSLGCCQAAIISQRGGLEGVAVPCKLYGILASGRAVLGQVPADSEVALVLREEQCGIVAAPGSVGQLVDAIIQMAGNREATEKMGQNAFAAYQAKYTLETAASTFETVLA